MRWGTCLGFDGTLHCKNDNDNDDCDDDNVNHEDDNDCYGNDNDDLSNVYFDRTQLRLVSS